MHGMQTRPLLALAAAFKTLSPSGHLCSLHAHESEQLAIAAHFMRTGLERGEKCVYLAEEGTESHVWQALLDSGVDVADAMRRNALVLTTPAAAARLKGDSFDPYRMLLFWKSAGEDARREGFPALRGVSGMGWILQSVPETQRWVEYEARLTSLAEEARCIVLCQYDKRLFDAGLLLSAVRMHPMLIHEAALCRNSIHAPGQDAAGADAELLGKMLSTVRQCHRLEGIVRRQRARLIRSHRTEHELRAAQAELARTARMMTLGELTASIAHEVAQPLASVLANGSAGLRWLNGDPPNLEEVRLAIARVIESGRRASGVIERIRALAGKSHGEKAPVEINEAIREVVALMNDELKRNQVALRTELDDSLPLVSADRVQLQQVMLNLIINAIEAIGELPGGAREIFVRTGRVASGWLQVDVRDTGIGLSDAHLQEVFKSFYTTKPHGMGIGLSISRTIVESHDGKLWATQNENGAGATFHFTLPLQENEPGPHAD
jgi:signal transduction histidine kinase